MNKRRWSAARAFFMAQIILSPQDAPVGTTKLSRPLAAQEKALGKVIDPASLRPGDLVLTSSVVPGFIAGQIRRVQERGGYFPVDAQWEHAAVYIGNGVVCEATRHGVHRNMLYNYYGTHHLRFRRDPTLSVVDGYEIAIGALSSLGYRYGFREILRLFRFAQFGFPNQTKIPPVSLRHTRPEVICSQLYVDAYNRMTSGKIQDYPESTPAKLSLDPSLSDVASGWLTV